MGGKRGSVVRALNRDAYGVLGSVSAGHREAVVQGIASFQRLNRQVTVGSAVSPMPTCVHTENAIGPLRIRLCLQKSLTWIGIQHFQGSGCTDPASRYVVIFNEGPLIRTNKKCRLRVRRLGRNHMRGRLIQWRLLWWCDHRWESGLDQWWIHMQRWLAYRRLIGWRHHGRQSWMWQRWLWRIHMQRRLAHRWLLRWCDHWRQCGLKQRRLRHIHMSWRLAHRWLLWRSNNRWQRWLRQRWLRHVHMNGWLAHRWLLWWCDYWWQRWLRQRRLRWIHMQRRLAYRWLLRWGNHLGQWWLHQRWLRWIHMDRRLGHRWLIGW